jgi:hypothetical protein
METCTPLVAKRTASWKQEVWGWFGREITWPISVTIWDAAIKNKVDKVYEAH